MTCRICLEPGDLISVCNCDGTSKWVHEECIKKWVSIRRKNTCEICHGEYTLDSLKPMVDEVSKKKHSYFVFIFTLIVSSSHAFQLWFGAETFNNDPAPAAVGAVIFSLCHAFLWGIRLEYMHYISAEWLLVFLTVFVCLHIYRPSSAETSTHILAFVVVTNAVMSVIGIVCGFREGCI